MIVNILKMHSRLQVKKVENSSNQSVTKKMYHLSQYPFGSENMLLGIAETSVGFSSTLKSSNASNNVLICSSQILG